MTNDRDREHSWLSQFEKNRFFQGKLMTPRDMEVDQEYHADRLHTLTRAVVGQGIVSGLGVESVTETDSGLEVTIDSGLALDGHGRPVVVEQLTTKTLPAPEGDVLSLYVRFSEVAMETVPVPDTDGADGNDAVANRAVEVFDLTYKESLPDESVTLPDIDQSVLADAEDTETAAQRLVEAYHEANRTAMGTVEDPAVFVGAFEQTPDGTWVEHEATTPRSFVYDQQLLFATLLEHVTDTDNPHETPVEEQTDDVPEDIEGITERLRFLETEMQAVKQDRDSLQRYAIRKSINDRTRFFERLADRIEDHAGEGGLLAREVADTASSDSERLLADETAYRHNLDELLAVLVDLGEAIEGVTTEQSHQAYLQSVSDLQTAIEREASLLELTEAHDQVCEAADSLTVLVNVVPDE